MRSAHAEEKPEVANLERFWDTLSRKGRKLLALDYDGTLAPFKVGRMEAFPLSGVVPLLEKISRRADTTVAVISGRPLKDLRSLLLPWEGLMIGSHGFEKSSPGGEILVRKPDGRQQEGLDAACELAEEKGREGRIEVKLASVAVHTRGLPEGEACLIEEEVGSAWRSISRGRGLRVTRFNRGLEIRAQGWDKGKALVELLGHEPEGTFCVYIGDDLTDEDAFRAIRTVGIGIKVGDPGTASEARGFLPDVRAVRDFLEAWSGLAVDRSGEG
jgi:trehalose 6-phosphate phosphatase